MSNKSDKLVSLNAVINIAMQYCPDDDGSCSKADVDLREMLDELENLSSIEQPMRADVYLWQRERMCHSFDKAIYDPRIDQCEDCPLIDCCSKRGCLEGAEAVDIVDVWAREHPEEGSEK